MIFIYSNFIELGSLHSRLRAPSNLVSCYLPRHTRLYIFTIRSLWVYFPRYFPLHLYIFVHFSLHFSSSMLLDINKSLIQFLEFRIPDRPFHSYRLTFRDAWIQQQQTFQRLSVRICVCLSTRSETLNNVVYNVYNVSRAKGESVFFRKVRFRKESFTFSGIKRRTQREPRIPIAYSRLNYKLLRRANEIPR